MEQSGCHRPHLFQPLANAPLAPVNGLILSSGPAFKCAVNVLEDAKHGCPIERAIVLPPPLYHWIVEPSHVGQRHVGLAIESPPAYRLPHPLQGIRTRSRKEAREELVLSAFFKVVVASTVFFMPLLSAAIVPDPD
jgi:hypothetical protein